MSVRSLPLLFVLAAAACAPRSPANVVLFEAFGAVSTDGLKDPGEWNNADCTQFPVKVPGGGSVIAELCIMNDGRNLYSLVSYPRATVDTMLLFSLDFRIPLSPTQGGGTHVDAYFIQGGSGGTLPFTDTHLAANGSAPMDTSAGGTNDGKGGLGTTGGVHVYELEHPLDSTDDAHDFSLKPGDVVDFCARVVVGSETTLFPATCAGTGSMFGRITIQSPPIGGTMHMPDFQGRICGVLPEACPEPDPLPHPCAEKPALCERPQFQDAGMFLYCTIRPCAVHDELPRNCLVKFPCPVPPGGGDPPFYHLTFTGLRDDWDVVLVDRKGGKAAHRAVPIPGGAVISFQPERGRHMPGLIGEYVAMFVMRESGRTGVRYEVKASLATSDRHYEPGRR